MIVGACITMLNLTGRPVAPVCDEAIMINKNFGTLPFCRPYLDQLGCETHLPRVSNDIEKQSQISILIRAVEKPGELEYRAIMAMVDARPWVGWLSP